jgi:hypothetical protein
VAVRLADALWMRVDADNEYEKKDNRQKKLDTLHEVKVLSPIPTNVPGCMIQCESRFWSSAPPAVRVGLNYRLFT